MSIFDRRLKLQKSIYVLKSAGIEFDYDFTWYVYGPYSSDLAHDGYDFMKNYDITDNYSPQPSELDIIRRINKGQLILNDRDKAEIIASFLYLKEKYETDDMAQKQLKIRKPRYTELEIAQNVQEWGRLTNLTL